MIGVHGRTIDMKSPERYRANWDIIRKVVQEVPDVPIIANGNIRNREDLEECLQYTGAAAVMSAQSLLDDPACLMPADAPIHSLPDKATSLMYEYLDLVENHSVPLKMVHGHMHSTLGGWLSEFTDIREETNRVRNKRTESALFWYRAIVAKVEARINAVYATEGRIHPIPVKPNEPLEASSDATFTANAKSDTVISDSRTSPPPDSVSPPPSPAPLALMPPLWPLLGLLRTAASPSPQAISDEDSEGE